MDCCSGRGNTTGEKGRGVRRITAGRHSNVERRALLTAFLAAIETIQLAERQRPGKCPDKSDLAQEAIDLLVEMYRSQQRGLSVNAPWCKHAKAL